MEKGKKFKVTTLGCRTNQYESAAYMTQLKERGYTEAKDGEEAELCIINTCTVTESADSSSRYQIRHLARQNPHAKIVVTGCLAERTPDELAKLPEVHTVITNKNKEQLLNLIFPEEEWPEFAIDHFGGYTRAFVKIQDGCNSFCTYCILPYVRGRSRSRRVDSILREIQTLIEKGHKEIVLTGINVGDFDGAPEEGENPVRLADLVRMVDQLEGLERLRISSIDPDEVDADLLDAVVNGKHTCQSMHIVLQSGSNAILKRMNRKYTRQIFLSTIEKLKAASPDFTFTTDVIVGFPGETDGDFEETMQIIQEVGFAKVHMFPYSKRERTRAALYPNHLDPKLIHERKQKLLRMSEQGAFELRNRYVGKIVKVLTEEEDPPNPGFRLGHSDNFLQVLIPAESCVANEIVEVECLENTPKGLKGAVCVSR